MAPFSDAESGPSKFRTTAWSVVAAAQDQDSDQYQQSLEYLCKCYWKPIYYYIRRRGLNHDTARDLTQEYFTLFLEKGFVESADRERGRFRTFMLTTLTRFLSKQYRKHTRTVGRHVPLQINIDDEEAELSRPELADETTAEDAFNRAWAHSLIDLAIQKMAANCTEGKPELYCKVFTAYIDSATDVHPMSYRELGERFGLTETDVTNYLHRGRNIFQRVLREEVRQSVFTESEVDAEIEELRRYFG